MSYLCIFITVYLSSRISSTPLGCEGTIHLCFLAHDTPHSSPPRYSFLASSLLIPRSSFLAPRLLTPRLLAPCLLVPRSPPPRSSLLASSLLAPHLLASSFLASSFLTSSPLLVVQLEYWDVLEDVWIRSVSGTWGWRAEERGNEESAVWVLRSTPCSSTADHKESYAPYLLKYYIL